MTTVFHYTDKCGYDGIRAATEWKFLALQPPPRDHPAGAYFTRHLPTHVKLARLLRISKQKVEFCFEFVDFGDLKSLPGGRGLDGTSLYSSTTYLVSAGRQRYNGKTRDWKG